MNVMSVSLLRLQDKRIALFYMRKNSVSDCRPYLRNSSDEARSWSKPVLCIRDEGYFVLNNDRAVQLRSGRILLPVVLHRAVDGQCGSRGVAMTYFSYDSGKSWRKSRTSLECPTLPATCSTIRKAGIVTPPCISAARACCSGSMRAATDCRGSAGHPSRGLK